LQLNLRPSTSGRLIFQGSQPTSAISDTVSGPPYLGRAGRGGVEAAGWLMLMLEAGGVSAGYGAHTSSAGGDVSLVVPDGRPGLSPPPGNGAAKDQRWLAGGQGGIMRPEKAGHIQRARTFNRQVRPDHWPDRCLATCPKPGECSTGMRVSDQPPPSRSRQPPTPRPPSGPPRAPSPGRGASRALAGPWEGGVRRAEDAAGPGPRTYPRRGRGGPCSSKRGVDGSRPPDRGRKIFEHLREPLAPPGVSAAAGEQLRQPGAGLSDYCYGPPQGAESSSPGTTETRRKDNILPLSLLWGTT